MGEVEINATFRTIMIHSFIYLYGDGATIQIANSLAEDIGNHWNEPKGVTTIKGRTYRIIFNIESKFCPDIPPEIVWYNTQVRHNYFRVEHFSMNHVSFVDGLGSNTGYFKVDNLLNHSTTAAHEYGHTLGLDHPTKLDIRGKGQPGIMYPRGTICDPSFQYDPLALPNKPGGTLDPFTRKVLQEDIDQLKIPRLRFDKNGKSVLGDFSSVYHQKHLPSELTSAAP